MSKDSARTTQHSSNSDEPQRKCPKTDGVVEEGKPSVRQTPVMRAIAVLPSHPISKRVSPVDGDSDASSEYNGSDKEEGLFETSDSDSGLEDGIPFPTRPKVIVPRTKAAEEHNNHS